MLHFSCRLAVLLPKQNCNINMETTIENPTKTRLTYKQAKFLKVLNETGKPTEAAMQAFDCKDRLVARVRASQELTKLNVDRNDLMDKMGLTEEKIFEKTLEGMEATRETINGEVKPDYHVRHKYIDTATKLRRMIDNGSNNTNNIQVNMIQIERYKPSAEFIDVEKKD